MSREGYRSGSAAPARANLPGLTPGPNPCLFVVGAARSGTTLLQRMLDAHPLLAQVGLPFDAAMQNYHVGRTRPKPGRSSKAQWLPPTPGLRDWTTQLAAHDIAAIEVAVGELLGELGYAPGRSPAAPPLLAHVDEVRSVFTANVRADDRPLPRSW